jgi:hypothetical protein
MLMARMSLPNQLLIVNGAIIAGLVFEYIRGAPVSAIVIAGIFLLAMVNSIFWLRIRRAKKAL